MKKGTRLKVSFRNSFICSTNIQGVPPLRQALCYAVNKMPQRIQSPVGKTTENEHMNNYILTSKVPARKEKAKCKENYKRKT